MRLVQVSFGEGAAIDENQTAQFQFWQHNLQCRWVHGDHHIAVIAGGLDHGGAEIDLKRRDPERGAGGGANFSREIREGGEIVAAKRRRLGELTADELHAVAGIAGKPNDGFINCFECFSHMCLI